MSASETEAEDINTSKSSSDNNSSVASPFPRTVNLYNISRDNMEPENSENRSPSESEFHIERKLSFSNALVVNPATLTSLEQQALSFTTANRWSAPLLPNNALITMLDRVAEIVGQAADSPGTVLGNQVERILGNVVLPMLEKVLAEEPCMNQENNRTIMSCIYRVINIIVAKLSHFDLPLDERNYYWQLLRRITYFNNGFYPKMNPCGVDHLLNIIPGDLQLTPRILSIDNLTWYTTVLVWLHQTRCYKVFQEYALKKISEDVPFTTHFYLIDWAIHTSHFFLASFNRKHIYPFVEPLLKKMLDFSEVGFNNSPLHFQEQGNLFVVFTVLRRFLENCISDDLPILPEFDRFFIKIHEMHVKLILRSLIHGNFGARLFAMEQFPVILQNAESINIDHISFLKSETVVEILFKDNLHHIAYIDRLIKIMNLLLEKHYINADVLEIIWDQQLGKHDAIKRNCVALIAKISPFFTDEFFSALLEKLEKSWNESDDKVKDLALDLMRRLGQEMCVSATVDKSENVQRIIDILWKCNIAESSEVFREKISLAFFDILQDTVISRHDLIILEEQIFKIADASISPPFRDVEGDPVAQLLDLLRKLIFLIPDEKIVDVHSRRSLIRRIDERFCESLNFHFAFGCKIAEIICVWIKDYTNKDGFEQVMEIDSTSSESTDSNDPPLANLKKRLDFLYFLIVETNRCYSEDFSLFNMEIIAALWKTLIESNSCSLLSMGFRFFRDVVKSMYSICNGPYYDAYYRFFEDCVLSVPPESLSPSGFKCFSTFLKFVNTAKGVMSLMPNSEGEDEEEHISLFDSAFDGEEYLCKVIECANDIMHKQASRLLEKIYSSFIRQSTEDAKIVVLKCVEWLESVETRRLKNSEDGYRMIRNTIMAILEIVEKNECDVCLLFRHDPSLRRSIAVYGHRIEFHLKHEMQSVFSESLIPRHINEPIWVTVNDNMVFYEALEQVCEILNNQGAKINPGSLVVLRNESKSNAKSIKICRSEWGKPVKDMGIRSFYLRIERYKYGADPLFDEEYQRCVKGRKEFSNREKQLFSYQLAQHPNFIKRLIYLADDKELLENCFQLLCSLPIKRIVGFETNTTSVEAYSSLVAKIQTVSSFARRLYYSFVLFESLLPATSPDTKNNSQNLTYFFQSDSLTSLLKTFSLLSWNDNATMEYEMFLCDILFRLIPHLVHFYMIYIDMNNPDRLHPAAKEYFSKLCGNMDFFVEKVGRRFRKPENPLPQIEYSLENLLHIIRAGLKISSNSSSNLFYSAILEPKFSYDEEIDDDFDPAQDQVDFLVLNCAHMLALLAVLNPERGKELLETEVFRKFLVDCCSHNKKKYVLLFTHLFVTVEKQLNVDHLMEQMIDYMFDHLDSGTKTFWKVLCRLVENFYIQHHRPLLKMDDYIREVIQWLKETKRDAEENMTAINQTILAGHLELACVLLERTSADVKACLGMNYGENFIDALLSSFLIPSSREFYYQRVRENGIGMIRSHTVVGTEVDASCSHIPRSASCILPSRTNAICTTEESQTHAYKLLTILSDSEECFKEIAKTLMNWFFYEKDELICWGYFPDHNLRTPGNFVGLKNGGATCYMNSIIQQLFMIPELRDPILNVAIDEYGDHPYQIKILAAIQSVFANLAGSELEAYTPDEFWNIFKLNERVVNVHEQQDAYEFYNKVLDLIDEGMEKLGAPRVGTNVFGGAFADEKICKDCPHRYSREEPFTSISVDVRSHNNIIDSLHEFVRGDILENDNAYHCEKCNKKVRAVKRMTIKRLPDNLVVQLKRFEFDWERNEPVKFNDYFEFPFTLDMRPYTTEAMNEDSDSESSASLVDNFECFYYRLRGVVVHSGQATGGHYFSYIRSDNNTWHKFDDTDVTVYQCDPQNVKHKWYGEDPNSTDYGKKRSRVWWNAFILIYEKATPSIPVMRSVITPLTVLPTIPLNVPLTIDANLPIETSRRSSTASPVTRLHKRFSNMSLLISEHRSRYVPPRLETKVRNLNTRIMHEKNEFSYPFFQFVHELILRRYRTTTNEEMTVVIMEILSRFVFYTMIRAQNVLTTIGKPIAFDKNKVIETLTSMLLLHKPRLWFINNIVLNENLSKSFLIRQGGGNILERSMYPQILQQLLPYTYEFKDTVTDLDTMTGYLNTIMGKQRKRHKLVFDLLLESLAVLLRQELNEELLTVITNCFNGLFENNLYAHFLKSGLLSAALKWTDMMSAWDHPLYFHLYEIIADLLCCIDFRPEIHDKKVNLDVPSPFLKVDVSHAIYLQDCPEYTEIKNHIFHDKLSKFFDLLLHMSMRRSGAASTLLKSLCWNNFIAVQNLLTRIFYHLGKTEEVGNLLEILYDVINNHDDLFESRRIAAWFVGDLLLPIELFPMAGIEPTVASIGYIKNETTRRDLLLGFVVVMEAYLRVEDVSRLINTYYPYFFDSFINICKPWENKAKTIYGNVEEFYRQASNIPTKKDVIIRLLLIRNRCQDVSSPNDSCSDTSDLEMDAESESSEQPLDLSVGTSTRTSATTPMLAEKRTLLEEDLPNDLAEAKKSRYSESGEMDDPDFLISTSTSAAELQERNLSVPPPPPYEDNSEA